MTTTPPPPQPGGTDEDPPPIETFTHYDQANDAYHCSYGPLRHARTLWDSEREIQVRLDETSNQVIGFSIPNFSEWHTAHADAEGFFDVDLPSFWPGRIDSA